jgi:hypothetical protein
MRHTNDCLKRQLWGDGECECGIFEDYKQCEKDRDHALETMKSLELDLHRTAFDKRSADRMAAAIDWMIYCGSLNSRSPAADARLEYGNPLEAEVAKKVFFDCIPLERALKNGS